VNTGRSNGPGVPRVIDRYALHDEIASGGMATVHYGRLRGTAGFTRTVAIKRLLPHLGKNPEFVAMVLDEARLTARIRHPNVVSVLDVVAADGELLLVMDYVHGESLARLLNSARRVNRPIPLEVTSAIVSSALHGVHAAHVATSESGEPLAIVHRDFTPQNILVGADGIVRVVDFGVARAAGRQQTTREGQIKGKPAYMSPEQVLAEEVDARTDVFAAGVVLWEALTLKRLFQSDSDAAAINKVLNMPIDAPSRVAPDLPTAFDRIALCALERNPARRYSSAEEMALAIEKACPPAPASQVGEWVRDLASDVLAQRADAVSRVETGSEALAFADEGAIETTVSGTETAVARRPAVRTVAALALVIAGASAAWVVARWQSPGAQSPEPSGSAPVQAALAPSSPAIASVAPPSADAPPDRSASASAIVSSAAPKSKATPPKPRAATRPDCETPYTIDSRGITHWKRECVH
jgi:serine/threonine-protein kinase